MIVMRHNPFFFILIVLIIMSIFSFMPNISATSIFYQKNSCENVSDWTNTLSTIAVDSGDVKEGNGSIAFTETGTGVMMAYINNTSTGNWGNNYDYTTYGCWLRIISMAGYTTGTFIPIYWYDNTTGYYMLFWLNLGTYAYWQFTFNNGSNHVSSSSITPDTLWHWYEIQHFNSTGIYNYYIDGAIVWTYISTDVISPTQFRTETVNSYAWSWKIDLIRSANIEEYPPTEHLQSYGNLIFTHIISPSAGFDHQQEYTIVSARYRISLNQSTFYTYSQEIKNGSVHYDINGTYYVLSSGTIVDWTAVISDYESLPLTQVLTGDIVNGNFSFSISPRISDEYHNAIYESIEVISMLRVNNTLVAVFTERNNIDYIRYSVHPVVPIAPYGSLDLTSWFVLFLIILCPIMILGFVFGKSGLLIGMVYSIGIGVSTHLLDPWFIIVIVIALIVTMYDQFRGR